MNSDKQYCTMRIAPRVRENLMQLNVELKKRNRRWSESRIVNLALVEWTKGLTKLNDTEIDRLFESYEGLWLHADT